VMPPPRVTVPPRLQPRTTPPARKENEPSGANIR